MAKIVIIVGHPKGGTYCEAVANAYMAGALEGRHEVRLFHTARMHFDPVLHEGFNQQQTLEPDIKSAHDAMLAADHLVFVFPLWLGTLPAIFKGFLERVLAPDLVEPAKTGKFVKVWDRKSARIIITMGMPAIIYRWWFGSLASKTLKRSILGFMGVAPVRATIFGRIATVSNATRAKWLEDARDLGRQVA